MEDLNTTIPKQQTRQPKWITAKLIFGIISMVLFALVTFQSCAAGLGNILSDRGEVSGTFGFVVAFNLLISGIIAVAARNSSHKLPWIICAILLWLNLFFARVFAGSFSDLIFWGIISFLIGVFYLISSVRTVKGYIIVVVISVLVFLLMKTFGTVTEQVEINNEAIAAVSFATEGKSLGVVRTSNVKTANRTKAEANIAVDEIIKKTKAKTNASISIEEAVLLDKGGVKVTVKGIDTTGWIGPEIKMLFENNSERPVTIQARNVSVNEYMIEPMMSVDILPGKKANDTMTLSNSDLKLAGITTIANIEFSFHVFDSETWNNIFDSEVVRIETSAEKSYDYTFDNSGNRVYYNHGVEIVIKGLAQEESWLGREIIVYIHNENDKNITIQARDVSVNGFMVDPIFSCDVVAGKHAMDTITIMNSDLKKNEIKNIESVELSFHIFDEDSWDTIDDSPVVTLTFD